MSEREFEESQGLDDWRAEAGQARASFATGSFRTGADLVSAVAVVADDLDHHPDVELHFATVVFTVTSHDAGGLTPRDVDLARHISRLARERGLVADPSDLG